MLKFVSFGVLAALAAGAAADAQDWTRPASFGGTSLQAGFTPDPHVRQLTAGGPIAASSRFTNCTGYIADAPDYSVSYSAGSWPLIFSVDSDDDTTLVINDPNGGWWCDDDGAEAFLQPMIRFDQPASGRYDVWVGTFGDRRGVPATLFISETGEHTRASAGAGGRVTANTGGNGMITANTGGSQGVDISLPARFGDVTLSGGFLPDPWTRQVTAGGPVDGDSIDSDCWGDFSAAPTVQLTYQGSGTLYIYTSGSADTTIAVNDSFGTWRCNDDGASGTNAGVSISGSTSGVYDIYVGVFGGGTEATTLNVSEIGYR
ncbi:MAG: hypothetical protein ABL308_02430 [Oceanicaulis sp.]